jgi:hypothetical protein
MTAEEVITANARATMRQRVRKSKRIGACL